MDPAGSAGEQAGGDPPFNIGIYIMLALVFSLMGVIAFGVVREAIKSDRSPPPSKA